MVGRVLKYLSANVPFQLKRDKLDWYRFCAVNQIYSFQWVLIMGY